MSTKWVATGQIVDFVRPRRPDRTSFPPHGDVPVRRALLVDNNKYHPRTARRDREEVKARSRLPLESTFYRPRHQQEAAE